ncbi:hypothetical protein N9V96_00460 [Polaribacter sp.]|nr:hypothetical protein [Polaribacter sp.]
MAVLVSTFATAHAQTPVVHLKFENNLNDDGSLGLTFELTDPDSYGFSVPYSSIEFIEGGTALNFEDLAGLGETEPQFHLVNNSSNGYMQSTGNLGIQGSEERSVSAWIRYDVSFGTADQGSYCIVNIGDANATNSSNVYGRDSFLFDVAQERFQIAVAGGNSNAAYDGCNHRRR